MLTVVPPVQPPVATKAPPSRGIPGKVLAALLLMALATAGVYVYQRVRPAGPPHPSSWDPRIAQMVAFVEHERGLTFHHPVYVDLLTDSEYALQIAGADSGSPNAQSADRRDLANAFGFAAAYDAESSIVLAADSTRGTYSAASGRILLRGTDLTPGVRVVLAHELTHALQAQHFDLRLGGPDDLARRSIAEADATRVANAYLATLAPDEQAAANSANAFGATEAETLARVPWPIVEYRFAPTWLGPTLVNAAAAAGGNTQVDDLLRHSPSDAQLISPWRPHPVDAVNPPPVTAPKGSTIVQPASTLPVLEVLVMLDAWLPWQVARGAVDHWASGSFVAYRADADARLCINAAAVFDAAPTGFTTALTAWAAAAGSTAAPIAEGRTVRFTACDRGAAAANPPPPVLGPSTELLIENTAVAAVGTADPATIATALCISRTLIDNPAAAPILALPTPAPDQQAVVDLSRAAARQTCGA
jgi:hypothetical protein